MRNATAKIPASRATNPRVVHLDVDVQERDSESPDRSAACMRAVIRMPFLPLETMKDANGDNWSVGVWTRQAAMHTIYISWFDPVTVERS